MSASEKQANAASSSVGAKSSDKANWSVSKFLLSKALKNPTVKESPSQNRPPKTEHFEIAPSFLDCIKDDQGVVNRNVVPYTISDPIKARVLIINIQKYHATKDQKEHERAGSEKDVDSLCQAFYKLGIKPEDIFIKGPELEKGQVIATINSFASDESNQNLDVFIIAVFAHGDKNIKGEDIICTSDNNQLELRKEIISKFNGENAPHLLHKPKLFFVEACRGGLEDRGKKSKIHEMCNSPTPQSFIPVETDILVVQPSAPEHKSYRAGHTEGNSYFGDGSYFIQFLSRRLYHEGQSLELKTIITNVAFDVARVEINPKNPDGKISKDKSFKQALSFNSSLRRPFYFFNKPLLAL